MTQQVNSSGRGTYSQGETTSRTVLREVKPQLVNLSTDSLYLVVEYPHIDVFQKWASGMGDFNDPRLYQGIPYEGMVLRRGAQGYPLGVWHGGARMFVTPRVDDTLVGTQAEGQGMGLLVQLAPEWLHQYGQPFEPNKLRRNVEGQLILFGIENPLQYPIRINRVDINLDVRGWDVKTFSVDEWRENWVGYARPRHFHFSSRSGHLEGFSIGSYKGNVRFKVYDKVAESEQRGTSRFWRAKWGIGEDEDVPVARFEWSIRCYQARFSTMRYLADYSFDGFLGLLNYVTQVWGCLRVPQEDNLANKSRWPLHPLWQQIRAFIDDYSLNYEQFVRPEYVLDPDIKPAYLNTLAGWLAGLQARVGVEKHQGEPASLAQALSFLAKEGHPIDEIAERAAEKWEVFSRLAGGDK